MIGHVEMNDARTVVAEHHKDEQNAKRCGWYGEEVDGDQVAQAVVEKDGNVPQTAVRPSRRPPFIASTLRKPGRARLGSFRKTC